MRPQIFPLALQTSRELHDELRPGSKALEGIPPPTSSIIMMNIIT